MRSKETTYTIRCDRCDGTIKRAYPTPPRDWASFALYDGEGTLLVEFMDLCSKCRGELEEWIAS